MIPAHPGPAGGPVYLDYSATTPVDPRVVETMHPYLADWFGNPSSGHGYAIEPKAALARARAQVAAATRRKRPAKSPWTWTNWAWIC